MADEYKNDVPYIVFESAMAREERHTRRIIYVLIASIVLMALSNMAWLWTWMQYDYVSEDTTTVVDVDSGQGGNANYIGMNGDIVNGPGYSGEDYEEKNEN